MEAYWTYALSTDMADFVHCEPRWYSTRVIALRMGGMQQYGISVSIFEQGNLQGNSSGPSDPPGLVVCMFFLFPPGAFRQLALSLYIEILTHQSYRAFVLTPVLQVTAPSAPLVALSPLRNHAPSRREEERSWIPCKGRNSGSIYRKPLSQTRSRDD